MDPRGIAALLGHELPHLPPGIEAAYEPLPEAADQAAVQTWLDKMSSANRACMAEIGTDLSQYGTWQTAADMDALRQALGAPDDDFLGYSMEPVWGRLRRALPGSGARDGVGLGRQPVRGMPSSVPCHRLQRVPPVFWEAYCNQPTRSCGVAGGCRCHTTTPH